MNRGREKMLFKYKELKERYELLLIVHNYLLEESAKKDEKLKTCRFRVDLLEDEKRVLQNALKKAIAEPEVEIWKTALDEDIEQYILREE